MPTNLEKKSGKYELHKPVIFGQSMPDIEKEGDKR
jgi:hypothetical protein